MIWDTRARQRVVIVDVHPHDYDHLADQISHADIEVVFVQSGREAWKACLTRMPSMWIVNMHLPDMSGIDLQTMLRDCGCRSPIALVGDRYRVTDERDARIAGANFYLAKPVYAELLQAAAGH